MAKQTDSNGKKLYELGYLLLPTVPEEKLVAEVENIKAVIAKAEGEVVAEDTPKSIALAYAMIHGASGKKARFDKAYFGWVKFTAGAAGAEFIKRECQNIEHLLRFMIIKTVKDEPVSAPRAHLKTVVTESPAAGQRLTPDAPAEAVKKPLDEAELDKTLERLAV